MLKSHLLCPLCTDSFRYCDVTCGTDGKLYALHSSGCHVLEIDPATCSTTWVGDGEQAQESDASEEVGRYACIAAGANGKLYAPPRSASHVIEIDPETSEVRQIGHQLGAAGKKYVCVARAANGKLYSPPALAGQVLEIDPNTSAVRLIGERLNARLGAIASYMCIAAASNGNLYAAPASASRVLEINPNTSTVRFIGEELPGDFCKYASLAAGTNGKLYAPPYSASKALEIDPDKSTVRLMGEDMYGCKQYAAIVAGSTGKLYAPPYNARQVLEIYLETSDVRLIGKEIDGDRKFRTAVVGANGKLYSPPFAADRVLEIDPQESSVRLFGHEFCSPAGGYLCIAATSSGKCIAPPGKRWNGLLEVDASTIPTVAHHVALQCATADFSDVDVIVEGKTFKGHRVILSRVPFFATSFRSGFVEQHTRKIEIPDVRAEVFQVVWHAIYGDDQHNIDCLQDSSALQDVVVMAHRWEMTQLQDRASGRLAEVVATQLDVGNVSSWFCFAKKYGLRKLEDECLRFIEAHGPEVLLAEAGRDWSNNLPIYTCIVDAAFRKRRRIQST